MIAIAVSLTLWQEEFGSTTSPSETQGESLQEIEPERYGAKAAA